MVQTFPLPHLFLVSTEETLMANLKFCLPQELQERCHPISYSTFSQRLTLKFPPSVILFHLQDKNHVEQVRRFLQVSEKQRSLTPIVLIVDLSMWEEASRLLSEGVAKSFLRPLNLKQVQIYTDRLAGHLQQQLALEPDAAESLCEPTVELGTNSVESCSQQNEELPATVSCGESASPTVFLHRAARSSKHILIEGETGVGKSRLARLIHGRSHRSKEPFIVLDCASIPDKLSESILFGHSKGAFTGAVENRIGKFAQVGRGTLFIDEINSLPLHIQSRLLRVVESGTFEEVGGTRVRKFSGRIVAASNCRLFEEVEHNRFRADLYYRLNVLSFEIPPLRERRQEIEQLLAHFLRQSAREEGLPVPPVEKRALAVLEQYDWPGNIRELRNVVDRALINSTDGVLRLRDLPERIQNSLTSSQTNTPSNRSLYSDSVLEMDMMPSASEEPSDSTIYRESPLHKQNQSKGEDSRLREDRCKAEIRTLRDALKTSGGNRTKAAEILGISRQALYQKIKKYGLSPRKLAFR